ncbi:MAG: hypothetical protein H7Z37_00160 [Pyrinomonadaceae bacterium]|nr:hypothetical protein [Pyrinomonadaceae bacterium]
MTEATTYFAPDSKVINRPIWREALWGADYLALKTSTVYYGFGVPRGDKSAVIVVPGFLGTDHYLTELYLWLWRIGYKPFASGIGWNRECLDQLTQRLIKTIEKAYSTTGKPVHLIGHSLGGILSRSAAVQNTEKVASVIALGSPFRGIRSHPLVQFSADRVRDDILKRNPEKPNCYTGRCDCNAVKALNTDIPAETMQTAIYTKTDGIVDWNSCVSVDKSSNFEVTGTHIGLVINPQVYRLIGKRLKLKTKV